MKHATRMHTAALALGLSVLAAPAAHAQGYIGGGVGPSRINIDCGGLSSCDKTGVGGKLYGGYLFAPQFGAELAYFDWGKAKATLGGGNGEVKGDGLGIGVAYIAPFTTDWNGVARIGLARNRGKSTVSALGVSASETFRSSEAYFGLGVGYNVTPVLTVTGEMDFSRVKYTAQDKASANLLTLGLRYKF